MRLAYETLTSIHTRHGTAISNLTSKRQADTETSYLDKIDWFRVYDYQSRPQRPDRHHVHSQEVTEISTEPPEDQVRRYTESQRTESQKDYVKGKSAMEQTTLR